MISPIYGRRIGSLRGLLAAAALIVLTAACGSDSSGVAPADTASPSLTPTPTAVITTGAGGRTMVIHLSEPSGGYQTGTARLAEQGGQTTVSIELAPAEPNAQPIHIHEGRCDDVGDVIDVLEIVIGGISDSVVDRPLSGIANGNSVINAHLSFASFSTFTACGDIPRLP